MEKTIMNASEMGKKGGSAKTEPKKKASAENGKKGGRPSTFESVAGSIKYGLYLKKGVPDARYNNSYKYTIYYTGSNAIYAVCKTLKEVIEASNKCNNITI